MADYYTEASFSIPLRSKAEEAWWRETIEHAERACREKDFTGYSPGVQAAARELELDFSEYEDFGDWEIVKAGKSTSLWVGSDRRFRPTLWAVFIQAFIRRFQPDRTFGFECSYSNDALEEGWGTFGGVAYFITAGKIESMSTCNWLRLMTDRDGRKLL